MYFRMTECLKRRIIMELRKFWQYHPRYPDLVDHIQGKYSYKERPSYGIIVKTGPGNRVDLSADNYLGIIESYVYKVNVQNFPGVMVEWVREDSIAIQNNDGDFPSPPGIYYIAMDDNDDEKYYVDRLYDAVREVVTMTSTTEGTMNHAFVDGTLRVYEMPAAYQLYEGGNYTVERDGSGKPTGNITLTQALTGGRWLQADYRWPGESSGPHTLYPGRADNTIIPGCVVAFGRRNGVGDRCAVVVQDIRRPAALEYGGKWDLTLDVDVLSRDVYAQQEISDNSVIYIWGILRPYMSTEGLEITDLSLGGESEEIYDENGDDYFYNSSFSMTISTDWSIHVPLGVMLRQNSPLSVAQARAAALMTDDEVALQQNDIQNLAALGLDTMVDPYFKGRDENFELVR
jgi:hypothetical protein